MHNDRSCRIGITPHSMAAVTAFESRPEKDSQQWMATGTV